MFDFKIGTILAALMLVVFVVNAFVLPTSERYPKVGHLFQGDIAGFTLKKDSKGAVLYPTDSREHWPEGIIPFEIDHSAFTFDELLTIRTGLRLVEDRTKFGPNDCLKFTPHTTEKVYLRLIKNDGCWSSVGKQKDDGAQLLSLDCELSTGLVAHELLHAVGFFHEEVRPDREDYIEILYDNIIPGAEDNFIMFHPDDLDLEDDLPYDLNSIMHSGPYGFSKNGRPTIRAKNPFAFIGQRKDLSDLDVASVRDYYNCTLF